LFARFLAENGLLLWEPGAAVSLDDCEALVQEADPAMNLGAKTKWALAAKLAARMLPQVFKPQSPVFELAFAPEHQRELEKLLAALPDEVFKASDSLGWVYQFWQAKRKDAVNASEVKIGADELPAVTQLFTEPYMVDFLLHNSLGAWWVTRHPNVPCPVPLTYLRTLDDGTPAAGKFEGWPNQLTDFKLLDPCCGSGHFLVAAFLMLVPMRMQAEGLSAQQAVDAVLANNLHGLEIDPRCVEIAVFALALAAWRFPDEHGEPLGVRLEMPEPRIACCGLKVAATPEDWMALVPDTAPNADYVRQELKLLHRTFSQAPLLGSLLDPARSLKNDLATSSFETLHALLETALSTETPATLWGTSQALQEGSWELALTAKGLLDAARLLDQRYHLVITNVPYLARGKQNDVLKAYCEKQYPEAKNDLANVFLERCLELSQDGRRGDGAGVVQIVMPQNWLFLTSYRKQRESLLRRVEWNLLARLGPGAFETISGEVVQAVLLTQTNALPAESFELRGVDASAPKVALEKATVLAEGEIVSVSQKGQLDNPDARVSTSLEIGGMLLNTLAHSHHGLVCGDRPRMTVNFWELIDKGHTWINYCGTVTESTHYGGKETYLRWCEGTGAIKELKGATNLETHAWDKNGIVVSAMRKLPVTLYTGMAFDNNTAVITANDGNHLPAIWSFCSSPEFNEAVRRIDQKINVTNATLVKVPFDLKHWQKVAAERYPNGLPKPYSDDPTQWLFHGHPQPSTHPLQVAIARLAGYRWPAESDPDMELSDEARTWIERSALLNDHSDDDGILCLPSVRGEPPAHDRLLKLLIASWETVEPG
ncbi:MAG: SAM-dependent DNA methyltransferase, partial [Alcaligenaceae bacterium]|nr:SAM-dependent DNA methyltransferase [Alcaligenaceae bacterium]